MNHEKTYLVISDDGMFVDFDSRRAIHVPLKSACFFSDDEQTHINLSKHKVILPDMKIMRVRMIVEEVA